MRKLRIALALSPAAVLLAAAWGQAVPIQPLKIGDQRQLFVDEYFIESLKNASLQMHRPAPAGKAIAFDQPWEGNVSGYVSVFQDGPKYRMYYRGWSLPEYVNRSALKPGEVLHPKNKESIAYAESPDGIRWTKPDLGLIAFNDSKKNNIIWDGEGRHNFSPFLDKNPNASPNEKYKAVGGDKGLYAFRSADGIRWELMRKEPVITDGAFDSLNVVFYDTLKKKYVAIYRDFRQGIRTVKYADSSDFVTWTPGVWADYGNTPREQLYTNATTPYFRAPQIYLAFPKRYVPWRKPFGDVPSDGVSEAVFMTSRDGVHWDRRFLEAFVRPGRDPRDWVHRNRMVATGVVPTAADELSIYVSRHYNFPSAFVERMTIRTDGFVSVNAGAYGGELLTRPFILEGGKMVLNFATSAGGGIRYEILDETGHPLPGHALEQTPVIYGDDVERIVQVQSPKRSERQSLAVRPVRISFLLRDADLYSVQFRD